MPPCILVYHGVLPFGALTGGAVAQSIGVRPTLFIGALGFLLSTFWLIFSPVRHLRELPHAMDEIRGTSLGARCRNAESA
jgi:hypothetical protein